MTVAQLSITAGGLALRRCEPALLGTMVAAGRLARAEGNALLSLRHVVAAALGVQPVTARRALETAGIEVDRVLWCLQEFATDVPDGEALDVGSIRLSSRLALLFYVLAGRSGPISFATLVGAVLDAPSGLSSTPTSALLDACRLR